MARRRAAKRARGWRWLALLALAISAVAFGRSPPSRQPPARPPTRPEVAPRIPPAPAAPPSTDENALRVGSPFFLSTLDCERALRSHPRRGPRTPARVGTWNLRWFPRGTARGRDADRRTDVRWMACAIASLDVDVLAVQEVLQDPEGRAALLDFTDRLDALTAGRWRAELDDCPGSGRQHVGLLYDASRVQLSDAVPIDALNPGLRACDRNLRPGFGAHARFADGSDAHLVAVHLDSGTSQRDHDNRQRSLERLGGVLVALQQRRRARDVIVLGDFNTMGCKDCVPARSAADELAAFDALLAGLQLKRMGTAAGQHALCSEYYRGHAVLLDHVVVAADGGRWSRGWLKTFGPCAALACGRQPRGGSLPAFSRLSDHCPLVAALPR